MILEAVAYFSLALFTLTLFTLASRVIRAHFWFALPVLLVSLGLVAYAIQSWFPGRLTVILFSLVFLGVWLAIRLTFRPWSWAAAALFAALLLASLSFLAYAASQTYARPLPLLAVILSTLLFLLEICALGLSISYAFEVCDTLGRREAHPLSPPPEPYPWVALQVATYNEPPELVAQTLLALANLDYPNYIVQVVDNNTKDPALWSPLARLCYDLGPNFHFIHLNPWPGYKAGALNEATRRLPEEIELIAIIDADYLVNPEFLLHMVGHFADPNVAFAQSSQHYRDWSDSSYLRGLFYSFRYFFDVTLPSRAHRNAAIFCGTMGLIRRSALEEIGGWSEVCITEDAEASLRLLGHGYRGVYDPAAYGAGIMPLDFDGLKKQRFRWALGGVQILRLHSLEFIPFVPHRLQLTWAQRLSFFLGSFQWFAELLTATFTLLLLATSLAITLHHQLPVRQLTGGVLAVLVMFAFVGLARALWALRRQTGCSLRDAATALRVWFALSWVVTLACLRGLLRREAAFLRTPKHKEGAALGRALWASKTESTLGLAALVGALSLIILSPSLATFSLAALLFFTAYLYGSAPIASIQAERVTLTAERRLWLASAQNTGERPNRPGSKALATLSLLLISAGIALGVAAVLSSPGDQAPFSATGPALQPTPTPRPSLTPSPTPSPSPTPTLGPCATPPTPPSTPAASPTACLAPSPTPNPTPSPTPTPTPAATPTPTPVSAPSPTPAGLATPG